MEQSFAQPFAQRVVVVTGAASGIGKRTAELFAERGAAVVVADIDADAAAQTASQLHSQGATAIAHGLDVADEAAWQKLTDAVLERFRAIHVLVNNAGISFGKPLTEMTLDEWRRVLAVNLDGVFLGIKYAARAMKQTQTRGSIVNVSSASGIKAAPGASAYSTSKAAVLMLTKTAALECAPDGIRVNAIAPSGVKTPMWENMDFWRELKTNVGSEEAAWQALSNDVPLKRFATADEIARAVLYLASDEAGFITGTTLTVDGGFTA